MPSSVGFFSNGVFPLATFSDDLYIISYGSRRDFWGDRGLKAEPEDQDLILCRRCQQGDVHALEELYRRHKDKVYALALRLTNNVQDAEDIVQDVFVQIYRKIGGFREDAAFTSWLYRIAINFSLSTLRRRKRHPDARWQETLKFEDHSRTETGKMLKPFLEAASASRPPRSRLVFVLHDVQGFKHDEIARMLDCSDGTSKSQLHKARAQLRKVLKPRLRLLSSLAEEPMEKSLR
jgi:RNA polymerase sigma-70 factor (ECF subfamily)